MELDINNHILSTIAYYDIFDYPLTSFEIWKYLITDNRQSTTDNENKYSLMDIIKELESGEIKKYVEEYQGFYFLKGRKELIGKRLESNKISGNKLKIIKKVVLWLRFTPYLRSILITGRVAMKNAGRKSDLDLLIILKNGRMFTGRFFVALITHVLGKRRYANKITDRICLNYFITDESLEISHKDLFSSHEYSFAFPIFGERIFRQFQENNIWIKDWRPNFMPEEIFSPRIMGENYFSKNLRKIIEILLSFDAIEHFFKKWQMKRIISDPRTHQKDSGVMANDSALIFLPEPQGPKIYEKYKKKLESLSF